MADFKISNDFAPIGGMDPRRAANALLLKIALEGKDFQKARLELAASERGTLPPVDDPPPGWQPSRGVQASTDAVALSIEIDRLAVTLQTEMQAGTRTTSVFFSHTHIQFTQVARTTPSPKKDPLVVDLDGSGPRTTGSSGAQAFDLAGDGSLAPTSFATGRTAFLALDRNANGFIDGGTELFGDQHGAADGYEELAKFDANGDHRIDASDPVHARLQLLFGDGTLVPIAAEGLASIALEATPSEGFTSGGDEIFRQAKASLDHGGSVETYALGLNRFESVI